jgi:hypothetical protein
MLMPTKEILLFEFYKETRWFPKDLQWLGHGTRILTQISFKNQHFSCFISISTMLFFPIFWLFQEWRRQPGCWLAKWNCQKNLSVTFTHWSAEAYWEIPVSFLHVWTSAFEDPSWDHRSSSVQVGVPKDPQVVFAPTQGILYDTGANVLIVHP